MDQNPNRTPSEHPNPTTKIPVPKWVVNPPTKMGSQNGFDNHSHLSSRLVFCGGDHAAAEVYGGVRPQQGPSPVSASRERAGRRAQNRLLEKAVVFGFGSGTLVVDS